MTKRKQVALLLLVGLLVPLQQSAKGQQALRPRLATTLCYPENFDWGWEMMCSVTLEAGKDPQCAATTDDHFQV